MRNEPIDMDKFFQLDPYSLSHTEKSSLLVAQMKQLTKYHMENNLAYKNILESTNFALDSANSLDAFPFLPVRIFKELDLVTNPKGLNMRSLNSSGTSGQATSRIFIDTETSNFQTKALVKIVTSYIGKKRLPLLIIDAPSTIKNRLTFSARAAGILGFSKFASDTTFALNDDMTVNWDGIGEFVRVNSQDPVLVFGFTSLIWIHLIKEMELEGVSHDLSNATLFHGGGWKKVSLEDEVSKSYFKKKINSRLGISKVHDYYGMAEQVGSILVECEFGYLHSSIFSEIIIRDEITHEVSDKDKLGLVETFSILPKSYPGHVLLTEDLGRQKGLDDCDCGRLGSYFLIEGRIKRAELRGCSDTYQAD
jgi:phenylacetate-coenzyme A ligase PaaK-like adenylate-forming protein